MSVDGSFRLGSTQILELKVGLILHRGEVALVNLRASDCTTGPVQSESTCVHIVEGQIADICQRNGSVMDTNPSFSICSGV